jgi:hypothetical protein
MTDEQRSDEGAEEAIEDLEAPAEAQGDVAGGAIPKTYCVVPSEGPMCGPNTKCDITRVVK